MSSELGEWHKQVLALRALTQATGVLHEVQVLQIKCYGAFAFSYTEWEAQVDHQQLLVSYNIKKKHHPKTFNEAVQEVDRSIHWLLGPEWMVRVVEGNTIIFQGHRKKLEHRKKRDGRESTGRDREGGE